MAEDKKIKKDYLALFAATFFISAFTFGGGYVIVPLMKKKFVEDLKWMDEKEMLDLIAIAQSSPGAIAVNTSILLGLPQGRRFGHGHDGAGNCYAAFFNTFGNFPFL